MYYYPTDSMSIEDRRKLIKEKKRLAKHKATCEINRSKRKKKQKSNKH